MGRGHKGVMNQTNKKNFKRCGLIPNQNNQVFIVGKKHLANNQKVVEFPEDVLNELRQMNPSVLAKTLTNM